MNIIECKQGSDEWFQARLGKVSTSHFSDVLAKGKLKKDGTYSPSKSRHDYMLKLATEVTDGVTEPTFKNGYMKWGNETEEGAREHYEALYDVEVKQVGFCQLNDWVGCSPDGLIGDNGGLELKCPKGTTHNNYILTKIQKLPQAYYSQVQGSMWVTGRKWWDWASYNPRNKYKPIYSIRVLRDEKYIENLKIEVNKFVAKLQEMINELTNTAF